MGVISLNGTVDNAAVKDSANLSQTKLQHRAHRTYHQVGGADVVAFDNILYRAYKHATVLEITATPDVVPAGGTKTLTIDVKKSTAGGAWGTILSGTTEINSSSVARTPLELSLSGSPSLLAGDILKVVGTLAGSGGTNVQGVLVEAVLAEDCV